MQTLFFSFWGVSERRRTEKTRKRKSRSFSSSFCVLKQRTTADENPVSHRASRENRALFPSTRTKMEKSRYDEGCWRQENENRLFLSFSRHSFVDVFFSYLQLQKFSPTSTTQRAARARRLRRACALFCIACSSRKKEKTREREKETLPFFFEKKKRKNGERCEK